MVIINYMGEMCHFVDCGLDGQGSVSGGFIGGFYFCHCPQLLQVSLTLYPVGTEGLLFRG